MISVPRSILLLLVLAFTAPVALAQNTLLIVGDSLSAAYGVPSDSAWVNLLRKRLDQEGFDSWTVVNASISGETTDGGRRRLPELLQKHDPEIVILELGGNDGLRGFSPEVIKRNLGAMIEDSQAAGARVLLVGIQIPPNYGRRYTEVFAKLFPDLAKNHDAALVPFFLEGIYNRDELMQDDDIHPTEAAQPRLLDNVWPHLKPLLKQQADSQPSAANASRKAVALRSDQ